MYIVIYLKVLPSDKIINFQMKEINNNEKLSEDCSLISEQDLTQSLNSSEPMKEKILDTIKVSIWKKNY